MSTVPVTVGVGEPWPQVTVSTTRLNWFCERKFEYSLHSASAWQALAQASSGFVEGVRSTFPLLFRSQFVASAVGA